MTTIAMTSGMVPSALAVSIGGEFRSPMAIAVIGGLILSTLLSLVFVPVLFSLVDGGKAWVIGLFTGKRDGRRGGKTKGAATPPKLANSAKPEVIRRRKPV